MSGPVQPNPRQPAPRAPVAGPERHYLLAWRLYLAAAALIAVSAFLPWVTALAVIQAHLSAGYTLVVLIVGALYAGIGYRVRERHITHTLLGGVWILNGVMALGVILIFKAAGGLGNELVSPAAGVFVCGFGVIAGTAATIQVHRAGTPLPRLLRRLVAAIRPASSQSRQAEPQARVSRHAPPPSETTPPPAQPAQTSGGFCDHCGNPIVSSQRFCSFCGTKQAGIA